jgi:hypothetical protein
MTSSDTVADIQTQLFLHFGEFKMMTGAFSHEFKWHAETSYRQFGAYTLQKKQNQELTNRIADFFKVQVTLFMEARIAHACTKPIHNS